MAKKDANIDQTADVFFVASQPVTPEPLWITGRWGDYPQWRCMFCPFDTLDGEAAMLEHWHEIHASLAPVVTPPVIQVYDHRGNPK